MKSLTLLDRLNRYDWEEYISFRPTIIDGALYTDFINKSKGKHIAEIKLGKSYQYIKKGNSQFCYKFIFKRSELIEADDDYGFIRQGIPTNKTHNLFVGLLILIANIFTDLAESLSFLIFKLTRLKKSNFVFPTLDDLESNIKTEKDDIGRITRRTFKNNGRTEFEYHDNENMMICKSYDSTEVLVEKSKSQYDNTGKITQLDIWRKGFLKKNTFKYNPLSYEEISTVNKMGYISVVKIIVNYPNIRCVYDKAYWKSITIFKDEAIQGIITRDI